MKVFPTSIECPLAFDLRGSGLGEERGEGLTDETCADSGFVGRTLAHILPSGDLAKGERESVARGEKMEPGHVSARIAKCADSRKEARLTGSS